MKQFILNADDFAKDIYHNDAVLTGYQKGLLNSTSIMSNMESYTDAINQILPLCPDLMVGIHLNLTEGKAINKNLKFLTDKKGNFKNGFAGLLFKSGNPEFLKEVEKEFESQIERAMKDVKLSHINSHMHIHAIPPIFEITARLAKKYNIPYIRTQSETPYKIKEKFSKRKYLINLLKVSLLNYFTIINKQFLTKYDLMTNDYIIGINYTGMMNKETILEGLRNVRNMESITECIIHPSKNIVKKARYKEYEIFLEDDLKERIINLGFEFVNKLIEDEPQEEINNIEEQEENNASSSTESN